MKKILSIIFIVCIIINLFTVGSYAAENSKFAVNAYFAYEDSESYLMIEGTTPALYSQEIVVMVYDPDFTEDSGIETLKDEYGFLYEDVSAVRPLSNLSKILRIADTTSVNGEFSIKVPIEGIENGKYMIISVGGSGKNSGAVSTLAYYETEQHLKSVTLPAFENATEDTIGALLTEKQYLLGLDLGTEYIANKEKIHSLFVSVRDEDVSAEEETGKKINSTDDVINIYKIATGLAVLPETPVKEDIENFVSKNKQNIDYDFSKDNKDYLLAEDEYAEVVATILGETSAKSMTDFAKAVEQAVGIVMLNSKDSTTIASVVSKYAAILGIDPDDYQIYCDTYTAYEVNKAFVAKNFTKPEDVINALKARIVSLEENEGSIGGDGGSSSGGSPGGSGGKNSSYFDKIVETAPEIEITEKIKFSDVSDDHWANEAICALYGKGVLNGFENGTFRPDAFVTREQFVKMIVTAFDLYYDNGIANFADVGTDRWSYLYIQTAASARIVNGVTKDEFMPEKEVTRQDAAVMLARLCEKVGISLEGQEASTDAGEISDYAKESVSKLKAADIISGFEDGSFRPLQSLTRAQAAKLIYGLISR